MNKEQLIEKLYYSQNKALHIYSYFDLTSDTSKTPDAVLIFLAAFADFFRRELFRFLLDFGASYSASEALETDLFLRELFCLFLDIG